MRSRQLSFKKIALAGLLSVSANPALAQSAQSATYDFSINTFFVAICAILVMWMMAGFTVVEAGFVRSRSVVNQCAKNIGLFAIASTCFFLVGYGLMFPKGDWIIPGILGFSGAVEIAPVATENATFAGQERAGGTIVFFQMMFCATIASIVSGALAERMKLISFFIFTAFLTAIIYPIQASWAWGGGFLETDLGFKDLAGSTVIHVAGGVAALTGTLVVGARQGRFVDGRKVAMKSFNLPLATLGALILWMGWFGFNAGSYLSIVTDADAANVSRILLNTNLAGAAGVLGAATISYFRFGRFDLSFMINGALAGLVSITAEPLYPSPVLAMTIGLTGGLIVVWAVILLEQLQIDDVVGAIPVHFFCGIWGTMAVVLSNPDATVWGQLASLSVVIAFVGTSTYAVWFLIDKTIGVRVSAQTEEIGIDESEMIMDI
jgi:Amt family ammonium transporter